MDQSELDKAKEILLGDNPHMRIISDYPVLIEHLEKSLVEAIEKKSDHVELSIDDALQLMKHLKNFIEREEELLNQKKINEFLIGLLKEAKKIMGEPVEEGADTWDKRARRALKALGLTSAKRESKINKWEMLFYYEKLRAGGIDLDTFEKIEGMPKLEALQKTADYYDLARPSAVEKMLQRTKKSIENS
jgi:hypothetical protein